jgi:hypothetical protein
MIPLTVRRMNASVTNQIMPKHSLKILTTISTLKYFGHIRHRLDSMEKDLVAEMTDGIGK